MNSILKIGGKELQLTNLEKVLFPKTGFKKGEIIQYYIEIAPVLLPHLKDRPLTLKRYPNGVEGEFFYEKRCPPFRPKWLKTASVWSDRKQSEINYCLANNLESLVWAINLADLELHTSLSKHPHVEQPTMMVFDLDPGLPANIIDCARVALWLKDFFEKQKLKSYAKTTGSKGLQLYVPLNSKVTYEQTKSYSHFLAEELTRLHPNKVLAKMEKRLRKGKVFVDWSQNDDHKTTVCVYSLRAKEVPSVSTPVTWEEVEDLLKFKKSKMLQFSPQQVLQRVERMGDLFHDVLTLKQKLPKIS
jgi:bifunctional non-homologous end joining protein LigD